ncbi:MAG: hypothetical protein OEY49_16550 [Candidatus Heimdallarchaeota archaeon]|nr:hypothetical protein [Candidatus Heimdallarchaeota archaeon]
MASSFSQIQIKSPQFQILIAFDKTISLIIFFIGLLILNQYFLFGLFSFSIGVIYYYNANKISVFNERFRKLNVSLTPIFIIFSIGLIIYSSQFLRLGTILIIYHSVRVIILQFDPKTRHQFLIVEVNRKRMEALDSL